MKAPLPANEEKRISKLLSYNILDTQSETAYDDIAQLAAYICQTPIALVSLVDTDRQWFKASVGLGASETPRDLAFCAYAILQSSILVVPDAQADPRFADNPLVTGEPHIRFYAGAPLITSEGLALGTLCVISPEPRTLSPEQINALVALSRQVVSQLELRLSHQTLTQEIEAHKRSAEARNQIEADLRQTQAQIIQAEKMSSLGHLVAGVAHEINNPVSFIHGNLKPAVQYTQDLLHLLSLYQAQVLVPSPQIQAFMEEIDLEFLQQDLPKLLTSMQTGTDRIREIVLSLRNFSRLDEAEMKAVDLHEGLENSLVILGSHLKADTGETGIEIIRQYGELPQVECYAGQLNQVFMHLLSNAIDALNQDVPISTLASTRNFPTIQIRTEVLPHHAVAIRITDNGHGIPEQIYSQIFNPFFTTKPVGKGTGLGLFISYKIVVEKHGGRLYCQSSPGQGTEFVVEIPISQSASTAAASLSTALRAIEFSGHDQHRQRVTPGALGAYENLIGG